MFKPLQQALSINPRAAKFIGGGYILIALAIVLFARLGDVSISPLLLALYLLIFSLLVLVLTQLPHILRLLLSWLLVVLFSLWLVALLVQVVTQNGMTPPIALARCLLNPIQERCDSLAASAAIPSSSQPTTVVENAVNAEEIPPADAEPPATAGQPDRSSARIFVQFAGFDRETVVVMSQGLLAAGWLVQGADRGGERLGTAAGLDEVRFFHDEDKDLALALAQEISGALPNSPNINVKDYSGSGLVTDLGVLEVWVSQ